MSARGWLLFSAMGVLWGVPYLMIKVTMDAGLSPSFVVFVRCALGAVLLLPFALRAGGRGAPGSRGAGSLATVVRANWRPMLAIALVEIVVSWWTLTDAERRLSSSTTGLLIAAVPVVGVLLARFFGVTERLGVRRLLGLSLGVAGVASLTLPGLTGGDVRSLAEVLVTVVGYATAPLIVARRLAHVPTLQLVAPCLAFAAAVYAVPAALSLPTALPSASVLAALAGLGVLCTALAFVVFLELIREVGPTRAVVFTYVNPAVAVVAGVLVLAEPFTVTIAVAFALILAGSVLATASGERAGGARGARARGADGAPGGAVGARGADRTPGAGAGGQDRVSAG